MTEEARVFRGWDEFRQIGTDYESAAEVAAYDARMRRMRDIDGENRRILELLRLRAGDRLLEIGCGTGSLLQLAATLPGVVCAGIDISEPMLQYARARLDAAGHGGAVTLSRAGFLSFEAPPGSLSAVVSAMAFHHLPDLWKACALRRIRQALKPGGRLVLLDVVFDWGEEDPEVYFERILRREQESRPNLVRHIAQEYSTLRDVLCLLIRRAGFRIVSHTTEKECFDTVCAIAVEPPVEPSAEPSADSPVKES